MKKLLNILILHVRFIYINYEIVFFFNVHVYIPFLFILFLLFLCCFLLFLNVK